MTRTSLDDTLWASLMLTMQQLPRAREIPQELSLGSATRRRCGALSRRRCGSAARVPLGVTCRMLGLAGPAFTTASGAGRCAAGGTWCSRRCARPCLRPALPADGLVLLDSTTCKAHRAASGAAGSDTEAECLGRSRGGICSKSGERGAEACRGPLGSTLHACADGAGRILRLVSSPGQHSDLRHAPALVSSRKSPCGFAGIAARDAALDRGYVSARPCAAFAAHGCAVHTPPRLGRADPPPWDRTIYAANASRFGEPVATTSKTCSQS